VTSLSAGPRAAALVCLPTVCLPAVGDLKARVRMEGEEEEEEEEDTRRKQELFYEDYITSCNKVTLQCRYLKR
jgi:hypothetical protein